MPRTPTMGKPCLLGCPPLNFQFSNLGPLRRVSGPIAGHSCPGRAGRGRGVRVSPAFPGREGGLRARPSRAFMPRTPTTGKPRPLGSPRIGGTRAPGPPFCILHFAFCTLHFALCTLHFALCTLHFALCIPHSDFCIHHSSLIAPNSAYPARPPALSPFPHNPCKPLPKPDIILP